LPYRARLGSRKISKVTKQTCPGRDQIPTLARPSAARGQETTGKPNRALGCASLGVAPRPVKRERAAKRFSKSLPRVTAHAPAARSLAAVRHFVPVVPPTGRFSVRVVLRRPGRTGDALAASDPLDTDRASRHRKRLPSRLLNRATRVLPNGALSSYCCSRSFAGVAGGMRLPRISNCIVRGGRPATAARRRCCRRRSKPGRSRGTATTKRTRSWSRCVRCCDRTSRSPSSPTADTSQRPGEKSLEALMGATFPFSSWQRLVHAGFRAISGTGMPRNRRRGASCPLLASRFHGSGDRPRHGSQ